MDLPSAIVNPGTTTIVDHALQTNAGNTVTVSVSCVPLAYGRGALQPRGDYDLCTVRKYRKTGMVTLTTYGQPTTVTVKLRASAIDGYAAYKKTKVYSSR